MKYLVRMKSLTAICVLLGVIMAPHSYALGGYCQITFFGSSPNYTYKTEQQTYSLVNKITGATSTSWMNIGGQVQGNKVIFNLPGWVPNGAIIAQTPSGTTQVVRCEVVNYRRFAYCEWQPQYGSYNYPVLCDPNHPGYPG